MGEECELMQVEVYDSKEKKKHRKYGIEKGVIIAKEEKFDGGNK